MKKRLRKFGAIALAASISLSCLMTTGFAATGKSSGNYYVDKFNEQYDKIKDSSNGYFSKLGLPYHALEELICDGPDYGHESTSETASYYVWLEAMKGKISGDYSGVKSAWDILEKYYIPSHEDQASGDKYPPNSPSRYAAEYNTPEKYPSKQSTTAPVGSDPLYDQLKSAYGNSDVYGMHWLVDVDNWYGYGARGAGPSSTQPVFINTYQRGPQESSFETITHPSWDSFKYGGKNGYCDLFVSQDDTMSPKYSYTNAPDADARAIQAVYDAYKWAKADGKTFDTQLTQKAAKMGDFLRYSMFDKHFRKIGKDSSQAGQGYDSCTYLLGWYYAWGGDAKNNWWAYKIGSSHEHQAYQSPMAAWILSTNSDFKPKSSNGVTDWSKSLGRQVEFYNWLQSKEGAIAAGCTNMWNGDYSAVPSDVSTFYGMGYKETPVYEDPKDNKWIGYQAWPMQRVAEYYYETGDTQVKSLVTKWADWIQSEVKFDDVNHTFTTPMDMVFEGQPGTWNESTKTSDNSGLSVKVSTRGNDIGASASLVNAISYIAAKNKDADLQATAKKMLDYLVLYRDTKGMTNNETLTSMSRINDKVFVPAGWTGKMPNGDVIDSNSTFLSIRSNWKKTPQWPTVEAALNAGQAPVLKYHRFWQQSDIAIAYGTYATLFPTDTEAGWSPDVEKVLLGDVNSDGKVNAFDLAAFKKYLLNNKNKINLQNADMDQNGVVNAFDYAALKKKLLSGK